ncbi:MAG: hypothetical protein V1659_06020, partial [Candidatus Woesearchaeota archaeon]
MTNTDETQGKEGRKFTLEEAVQELRKPENRKNDDSFIRSFVRVFDRGVESQDPTERYNLYAEICRYDIDKRKYSAETSEFLNSI